MEAFARHPDAAARARSPSSSPTRLRAVQPGAARRRRGRAALHRGRRGRAAPGARRPARAPGARPRRTATVSTPAAGSWRPRPATLVDTSGHPVGGGPRRRGHRRRLRPPAGHRGRRRPGCAGSGSRCSRRRRSRRGVTTSLADADTLRYYPAYEVAPLELARGAGRRGRRAPPPAAPGAAPRRRAHHRRHPRLRRALRLRAVRGPHRGAAGPGPRGSWGRRCRRCGGAGRACTPSAPTARSACGRRSTPACGWSPDRAGAA